jgi:phosphoribosyl-ATP pyrophosphohydrolase
MGAREKAKEEVQEYFIELHENKDDQKVLKEASDTIITMFQDLMHRGLLEELVMTIELKSTKGLNSISNSE